MFPYIPPSIETHEFYSHEGKKVYRFSLIPERGAWLSFEMDESGNLFVKIDASKKMLFSFFLRVFENRNDLRWLAFLKTLSPMEKQSVEQGMEKMATMFLDERRYTLSLPVRSKLNQLIHSEADIHTLPQNECLTKKDIVAIGHYLTDMKKQKKRDAFIESVLSSSYVEKEIDVLQVEMDVLLEKLHDEKNQDEKDRLVHSLLQNRLRYNHLTR